MMFRSALRALLASLVLAAIIVGLPTLLLLVAGSPVPERLPSLDDLTRRADGTLIVIVLEYLAWGAWAWFTLSTLTELLARLRGRTSNRPRIGMRRLAAYLLTAATVTLSGAPAFAASPTPAAVVATAPPPQPDSVYKVKPGDTLWEIADKKLGSPKRWPRIWKLNAHHRQVDGRVFTDPDLIHSGWKLRLPIAKKVPKSTAVTTPSPRPSAPPIQPNPAESSPAPALAEVRDEQAAIMIRLPSGSLVTMAYVAGISTALAASRLRHRHRRTTSPGESPPAVDSVPTPEPEPAVREARQAYVRANIQREQPVPADHDLLRERHAAIDAPDQVTLGHSPDGHAIQVQLAGLGLGLTGDGTVEVAAYVVNDLLRQASNFRVEVIMCTAVAETLYGPASLDTNNTVPGLVITDTALTAFRKFQELLFTRKRILVERDADDLAELRDRDLSEALPTLVLITEPDDELYTTVGALLLSIRSAGCALIVLGDWPTGTTCRVGPDHRVLEVEGALSEQLTAAELCHLTSDEARQHLRELSEPQAPTAEPEATDDEIRWNGPELIRLSILGQPLVHVRGRAHPLELSWLQLNVLAFLALHPDGVTNAQLTTALWPDEVGKDLHSVLRHLRETLVNATSYENSGGKSAPFIGASTTKRTAVYRIDTSLISVDFREYQAAVEVARAGNRADQMESLNRASTLCRGELLHGIEAEWIDEHRYSMTRSLADTLTRLATLCERHDPEQALDTLERVRELEPEVEENYLKIAELQLRIGRRDDVRRTVALLRQTLDNLGLAPTPQTEQRLKRIAQNTPPAMMQDPVP